MGKVSRQRETIRKNQKEILQIKTLAEMKNTFDGFIHRLDI